MTDKFIKIYNSKFKLDFCNNVIKLFNNETQVVKGVSAAGLNLEIKDTTDYKIPSVLNQKNNSLQIKEWLEIDSHIHNILSPTINEYVVEINNTLHNPNQEEMHYLNGNEYTDTGHQIQKYIKNEGHYKKYHNDFSILSDSNYYRVLTYIIYLNTVDEGGETVFFGNYKIKPTAGSIVIFPAAWTHPHCGKVPVSDDKYIITGWLYKEYKGVKSGVE